MRKKSNTSPGGSSKESIDMLLSLASTKNISNPTRVDAETRLRSLVPRMTEEQRGLCEEILGKNFQETHYRTDESPTNGSSQASPSSAV